MTAHALEFENFLRARHVKHWADYIDWHYMAAHAPGKMKDIMDRFARAQNMDVSPTRSYPHRWSFRGEVDGHYQHATWTGPPRDWYTGRRSSTRDWWSPAALRDQRRASLMKVHRDTRPHKTAGT